MLRTIAAAAVLGSFLVGPVHAGDEDGLLTVGDAAPDIDITHWLTGEKNAETGVYETVSTFEDGKVYVLEFWATWCGPCKASMPHISSVQEKYKDYDVTVIGVSDEPLPTVVKWLCSTNKKTEKPWYETIGYALTTDPDMSVKKDFFVAAGQSGIPCTFIIGKDGHVEWIGHPMEMDDPLDQVVRDSWDRAAYRATWEKEQAADREMARMRKQYFEAMDSGNWDTVLTLLDEMVAKFPDNPNLHMQKFSVMLIDMNRPDQAYAFGHELLEKNWDNAGMLNGVAWMVVDNPKVPKRDLGFAMKAAECANELTDGKDAAILDTLARVHYENGDLRKAIRLQKMAVEIAGDGPMGEGIRKALDQYMSEKK